MAESPSSGASSAGPFLEVDAEPATDARLAARLARLLDGLNSAQVEAVRTSHTPLCILAGAGAGKTRVLTRRIAYQCAIDAIDAQRVLALTFTRRAAGELRDRLGALGLRHSVAAGTFHSVAYTQLRARWRDTGRTPPELLERKGSLVQRLTGGRLDRPQLFGVIGEIEWAKVTMTTPEHYAARARDEGRSTPIDPERVAELYHDYEDLKRARRLMDFDDLLSLCADEMVRDEHYAEAQRWRRAHLFVDEFQDVNPLQFHLLRQWLGSSSDLCVVGDPRQAIYGWNGADWRLLTQFDRHFGATAVVELRQNYRSTPSILAAANAVMAGSKMPGSALEGMSIDGPTPVIREAPDDATEATMIARKVRDRHAPGHPWSGQAILVRTNAQTPVILDVLDNAGIPARVGTGQGLLDVAGIPETLSELRRLEVPLAGAVHDIAEIAGPNVDRAALGELRRLAAHQLALDPEVDTKSFVGWLHASLRKDMASDRDAVTITTFHAAKGLEWPIVHLAGLEQGLVPHHQAKTMAARAEERRLLYVAITRARQELWCSWARSRTFGTTVIDRRPSRYLEAIARSAPEEAEEPDHLAELAAVRDLLRET